MMWHLGFCVFLPIALSSNIILFIYISICLLIHAFFQVNIGLVFNFFPKPNSFEGHPYNFCRPENLLYYYKLDVLV